MPFTKHRMSTIAGYDHIWIAIASDRIDTRVLGDFWPEEVNREITKLRVVWVTLPWESRIWEFDSQCYKILQHIHDCHVVVSNAPPLITVDRYMHRQRLDRMPSECCSNGIVSRMIPDYLICNIGRERITQRIGYQTISTSHCKIIHQEPSVVDIEEMEDIIVEVCVEHSKNMQNLLRTCLIEHIPASTVMTIIESYWIPFLDVLES